MGESGPLANSEGRRPDVFLLPLAVPRPETFRELDPGVLARRIPDFLHQVLNRDGDGPTALLEIQSPPEDGPARWVVLPEPPSAESAFALLPEGDDARAVVAGVLEHDDDGLWLELRVAFADGAVRILRALATRADPVRALTLLVQQLARVLGLARPSLPPAQLTRHGAAFFKYLEGLDGAALLSGELSIASPADGTRLMRPFADALRIDPGFGLALRTAHAAMANAVDGDRMTTGACTRVLEACLRARPDDGEACVAVAEQLTEYGDEQAAREWLEHAARIEPPPARGLESLGIQHANEGDPVQARHLWLRGVELDGHPDFFAHLARLAFAEDDRVEAWDKVIRGLRRVHERAVRAREWEADGRGCGVLLRYLVEHLGDHQPPQEVVEGLLELTGLLVDPEDRIDLGLCLKAVGRDGEAVEELQAGLAGGPGDEQRDAALHALLGLAIDRFEERFRKAVDRAVSHREPAASIPEFDRFLAVQPDYWPALLFRAIAARRGGDVAAARADLERILATRPSQPDALHELAVLQEQRGDLPAALALIEQAVAARDDEARLHARKAELLLRLERFDEARSAVRRALELDPADDEAKLLLRRIRK